MEEDEFVWIDCGTRKILVKKSSLDREVPQSKSPAVRGLRRMSEAERFGTYIQTGRHFETYGELDAHLKANDLRVVEKGCPVSEKLKELKSTAGAANDNDRKMREAIKAGAVPFCS